MAQQGNRLRPSQGITSSEEAMNAAARRGGRPFAGDMATTHPDASPEMLQMMGLAPKPRTTPTTPSAYTGGSSSPAAKAQAGGSINPAYIIGGVAAAGMGAAALEQYQERRKHTPSIAEQVGSGIVSGMDTVVNGLGNTIGTVMQPLQPIMMGGIALDMLGAPVAGLISRTGWKAPERMVGKAQGVLHTVQETTFSQAAKKISPTLGATVETTALNTVKFASPLIDKVAKTPGLSGLHSDNLSKSIKTVGGKSAMNTMMMGAWRVGAGLGVYGVARDFGSQVYALRQMQADMTGKDVSDISTLSVLTGSVAKPVEEARSKLLKLSGVRAFSAVAGLALALKSGWVDQKLGKLLGGMGQGMMGMMLMMKAYELPDDVAKFAETIVGEPILQVYDAMRNAEAQGEKFTAEHYAMFLLRADESLANRGRVGEAFALELGRQFEAEGTKLAAVLTEVSNGGVKKRVDAVIAQNAQAKAAQQAPAAEATTPAPVAETAPTPAAEATQTTQAETETSWQQRVGGKQEPLKVAVRPEIASWAAREDGRTTHPAAKSVV